MPRSRIAYGAGERNLSPPGKAIWTDASIAPSILDDQSRNDAQETIGRWYGEYVRMSHHKDRSDPPGAMSD
jgi:hypothetical protein